MKCADKKLLAMGKGCQCFDAFVHRGEGSIHSDYKNLALGDETKHISWRAQTRAKSDCGEGIVHDNGEFNTGGDGLNQLGAEGENLKDDEDIFMISNLDVREEKSKEIF